MSLPKAGNIGHAINTITRRAQIKGIIKQCRFDRDTIISALKFATAPAILVACIESNTFINYYGTDTYLAPILGLLALPQLPRAKLLENNFRMILAVAVSYCYVLFAGWCALKARQNTTGTAEELQAYNSSAEAVTALFLVFFIWLIYSLRSAFPLWTLSCQIGGIFAVATLPSTARVPNMGSVITIASKTLELFYIGLGTGLVLGLVIFPRTCRDVFMSDLKACLQNFQSILAAQIALQNSLRARSNNEDYQQQLNASVAEMKSSLQRYIGSVSKLRANSEYAEREFSYSRLDHVHLQKICSLLVAIVSPASGLSSAADMLTLALDEYESEKVDDVEERYPKSEHDSVIGERQSDWHELIGSLREQSRDLSNVMSQGATHASMRLGLFTEERSIWSLNRRKRDEETPADAFGVGGSKFLDSYHRILAKSVSDEQDIGAAEEKIFDRFVKAHPKVSSTKEITVEQHRDNVYYFLMVHVQTLLSSTAREFLEFLMFIEETHSRPNRLIIPRLKHMKHLLMAFRFTEKASEDISDPNNTGERHDVQLGTAFYSHRNPDHLPPENVWEKLGDMIRRATAFFGSEHSKFGARGACAIMTVAITAFLRSSQSFYFKYRLLWTLFGVLMNLNPTAGSSTFAVICRFAATMTAMIGSYIVWYITDQKTPGIIVFLWLWYCVVGYVGVVFPAVFGPVITTFIASTVMNANELQVRKLGAQAVEASGQSVFPPYIIFPFRLAIVTLGICVTYFWTIFPCPAPEHTKLRNDVASSFYVLANYYMAVQHTLLARLSGTDGDPKSANSPAHHLAEARQKLFRKYQALRSKAQMEYQFLDWEIPIGGKFPKQIYGQILTVLGRVESYMTLIGYTSRALPANSPTLMSWWNQNSDALNGTPRSHLCPEGVVTRLTILRSCLAHGHTLPPALRRLQIPDLSDFLAREVPGEEGFASAALVHTVNYYMVQDVNKLTDLVTELVGELDFSFTFDSTKIGLTMLGNQNGTEIETSMDGKEAEDDVESR